MREESLPVMPHKDPEVARAYRKANAERRNENSKRWKASLTPEQLEAYNARARKRREDDPERYRKYESTKRLKHREAILKRKRDYHNRNREREIKRMRESAAQNREQRRASCAKWYLANQDASLRAASDYYQLHRTEILTRNAERNSRKPRPTLQCEHCGNPFVRRMKGQRFCGRRCSARHGTQVYNNHLRANGGSFTAEQWKELKSYFRWRCAYCGTRKKLQVEHIQPVSRGGSNDPLNLVPACVSCNSRKHNSNLIEFLFIRPITSKCQTRGPQVV